MNWTNRRLHKWLAVSVSAMLLAWALTGIVMEVGPPAPAPADPPPADWTAARVAPAAAVDAARAALGLDAAMPVRHVGLRRLGARTAYEVVLQGGRAMVDAATGERIVVDSMLVVALARAAWPQGDAGALNAVLLTAHDLRYPWGDLPIWRVELGAGGTLAYVSPANGAVALSDRRSRFIQAFVSLHDLYTVRFVTERDGVRVFLLVALSLVLVVVVVTGLWLALPRRRAPRAPAA